MNKKGFTLAELMGVLVILGIVSTVVTIGVSISLNKAKSRSCYTQEKTIVDAAKMYFTDNSSTGQVSINELIENGYLDKDIENPMTGSKYDESTKIKKDTSKYTVEYADGDKNCENILGENIEYENPTLAFSTSATTNSIKVIAEAFAKTGISEINIMIKNNDGTVVSGVDTNCNDITKDESTGKHSRICTFNNLNKGTSYKVSIKAVSNAEKPRTSSEESDISTIDFLAPTIVINDNQTANPSATITFPSECNLPELTCKYIVTKNTTEEQEYKVDFNNLGVNLPFDTSVNLSAVVSNGKQSMSKSQEITKRYTSNFNKGVGVKSVGTSTGFCDLEKGASNCEITLPSITVDSGYGDAGWYDGETKVGDANAKVSLNSNASYEAKARDITCDEGNVSGWSNWINVGTVTGSYPACTCSTKTVSRTNTIKKERYRYSSIKSDKICYTDKKSENKIESKDCLKTTRFYRWGEASTDKTYHCDSTPHPYIRYDNFHVYDCTCLKANDNYCNKYQRVSDHEGVSTTVRYVNNADGKSACKNYGKLYRIYDICESGTFNNSMFYHGLKFYHGSSSSIPDGYATVLPEATKYTLRGNESNSNNPNIRYEWSSVREACQRSCKQNN